MAGLLEDSIADTMSMRLEREDFTYGEVHDATFLKFLNSLHRSRIKCGKRAGTRSGAGVHGGSFYDMGCGLGKPVFLAALSDWGFSRCVGVEMLPRVLEKARVLNDNLQHKFQQHRQPYHGTVTSLSASAPSALAYSASTVRFVQGDVRTVELPPDVRLVYICSQMWGMEFLQQIRDSCFTQV
jgi:SAM-dependent methyltransferase